MKIVATLIATFVTLSGCSMVTSAVDKGAEANDATLKASEFAICRGASVGAVMRRYNTPELVKAWQGLCRQGNDGLTIIEMDE